MLPSNCGGCQWRPYTQFSWPCSTVSNRHLNKSCFLNWTMNLPWDDCKMEGLESCWSLSWVILQTRMSVSWEAEAINRSPLSRRRCCMNLTIHMTFRCSSPSTVRAMALTQSSCPETPMFFTQLSWLSSIWNVNRCTEPESPLAAMTGTDELGSRWILQSNKNSGFVLNSCSTLKPASTEN